MHRLAIALAFTLSACSTSGPRGGSASTNGDTTATNNSSVGVGSTHGSNNTTSTNNATNTNNPTTTNNSTTAGSNNATTSASPWVPPPGTTWQWQLQGTIDTSVDVQMYDIDLFDTPQQTIDDLHAAGRIVICYFSAGTYEDWRPDKGEFAAADRGNELPDWPGEYWLDVRSTNVRKIMKERLDLALSKNCDGVEPDNVDGVQNDPGFDFTTNDQLDYDRFLASEAHSRGLSVGLKNGLEMVPQLEPAFDWALNEECLTYNECDALKPFIDKGKAVFHTEYVDQTSQGAAKQSTVCASDPMGFSTIIKTWDLDAWRLDCN